MAFSTDNSATPASGRPKRRWLRWVGLVVVLLGGAAAFALYKLDALLNKYKEKVLPQVAAMLGRPVTLGHVSTTLLHGVGAKLEEAVVAADPNSRVETSPLLEIKDAEVNVAALPAIFSMGKRIQVRRAVVDGLVLTIIRYPDGTLNVDKVADQIEKSSGKKPPPTEEERKETREFLEGLSIDELALRNAKLRFIDSHKDASGAVKTEAPVEISQVDLELRNVSLKEPFSAALSAAVLSQSKNLQVDAKFGKAPQVSVEDEDANPPLEVVKVVLAETDLSPLAPFLERFAPGLLAARAKVGLDAKLGALAPGGKGPTEVKGDIALGGLQFEGAAKPFNASAQIDLSGDPGKDSYSLRNLLLAAAEMELQAKGNVSGIKATPHFEGASIVSKNLDFDRLRTYFPEFDKNLGVALHGSMAIEGTASGSQTEQSFTLTVDLTPASIVQKGVFEKSAGTPLRLAAIGQAAPESLVLRSIRLDLANFTLQGGGTAKPLSPLGLDAKISGKTEDIGGLVRLLPQVKKSLPEGKPVEGKLAASIALNGRMPEGKSTSPGNWNVDLDVRLDDAKLKLPDVQLMGKGQVLAKVKTQGNDADIDVNADLGGLGIVLPQTLSKPSGTPLKLNLQARQTKQQLAPKFSLEMPGLSAQGEGKVERRRKPVRKDAPPYGATDLSLKISTLQVGKLAAFMPSIKEAELPPYELSGDAHVAGTLDQPETLRISLKNLSLKSGKSDLSGSLELENIEAPKVALHAKSRYLEMDDLVPKAKSKSKKELDKSMIRKAKGEATLEVAAGRAAEIPFQKLNCVFGLSEGRATAKTLEVDTLGGRLSGSGTWFDLADPAGTFHLVGSIDKMGINDVLSQFLGVGNVARGTFSGKVELDGSAATRPDLLRTVTGLLGGKIEDATLLSGSLADGVARSLVAKLPFGNQVKPQSWANLTTKPIEEAATSLKIQKGAMELAKPLGVTTGLGQMQISGKTFLDGRLGLDGQVSLPPAVASKLVGNLVSVSQPVPIDLAIGGTVKQPTIALKNLDNVAKTYAMAYVQSAAGQALKKQGEDLLKKTGLPPGAVPTSAADAEAAARKAAEDAKAKAMQAADAERQKLEAERQRLEKAAREEAERRKKEAEERLKNEGMNKLKGMFGR